MADTQLPPGWKILRSDYLHKRPWLTVRQDSIQIASGHVIPEYYVLEYPDWINVLAITTDLQFLLVRQFRYGLGAAHYELCAGVRDPSDASPLEAAQRELLEETGYGGGHWREWMRTAPNPATSNNFAYTFLATEVSLIAPPQPEDSEEITVHLFSREELLSLMRQGGIVQATHLVPLWRYMAEQDIL